MHRTEYLHHIISSHSLHKAHRGVVCCFSALWLCLISGSQVYAQPFQKIYTHPNSPFFIVQGAHTDTAQGYFVTGAIQSLHPQVFVLKTALDGQPIWSKSFAAGNNSDYYATGNCIRTTSDGGIAISLIKELNSIVSGGVLLKTNSLGMPEWARFAPCAWRKSQMCTDEGNIYYASSGKGVRKVYLSKISNAGQVLWEQWVEAGNMDFYNVESLIRCSNGDIVLTLLVSKIEHGTLIGPEQTILVRINPAGAVQQVAFFPVMHLATLSPLSDGRIAFRCSASDITWTGMGVMDEHFNWLWFKKAGFGYTPFLPNINSQELAISSDETRIYGIFYTAGGEKIALTFDTNGNLLQEEVYFSGAFAEQASGSPGKGYIRVSGVRTDAFMITGSDAAGNAFEDCYFPVSCGLQLRDTVLSPEIIPWQISQTACMEQEVITGADIPIDVTDYCVDPGPTDASFRMSDTSVCTGEFIRFERQAGRTPPVFGSSEWLFEEGVPLRATGPVVENIRFNKPGLHTVRHIFTLAGCRDTAFATIRVLPPPELHLGSDTTICAGSSILLSAEKFIDATYHWNTGDSSASIPVYQPGNYAVTVTRQGACSATDDINIQLLSKASVSLGPDTTLCPASVIQISAPESVPGQIFTWNTGATGPVIDISVPGLYSLLMTSGDCSFSDTILVQSSDCSECQAYIPNVFAPESGSGSSFQVFPSCPILVAQLRIYNRWGGLIYESTGSDVSWDGRLNGKILPTGVYLYDAELQLAPVQRPVEWRRWTGSVLLLR